MIGFLVLSVISANSTDYDYNDLINEAYNCRNATQANLETGIIEKLTEIEHFYFVSHSIPDDLRGMFLLLPVSKAAIMPKQKAIGR